MLKERIKAEDNIVKEGESQSSKKDEPKKDKVFMSGKEIRDGLLIFGFGVGLGAVFFMLLIIGFLGPSI